MFFLQIIGVQKKWQNQFVLVFVLNLRGTLLMITTGAEGHFVEPHADRCLRCILQNYF
jgi:hypothetical protein